MKKRIRYLLITALLVVLMSCAAAAKDAGEAYLKVQDNQVMVYLNLSEGQNVQIMSARFKLYVDMEAGELNAPPEFQFSEQIMSEVKSASVTQNGHEYYVDIILSGSGGILDQVVNDGAGMPLGALIGTLTLNPKDKETLCAEISLMAEDDRDDSTPIVEYVGESGAQAHSTRIATAEPVYMGRLKNLGRECRVVVSQTSYVYDGTEKRPPVTVADGEKKLVAGEDYELTYRNNIGAGLGVAVVTAIEGSGYEGYKSGYFDIQKAAQPEKMPASTIRAARSARTLADVALPEGWSWEDKSLALVAGGTVTGTAVYKDTSNYETWTVLVAVSKEADPQPTAPEQPKAPQTPDKSKTPNKSKTSKKTQPKKKAKVNVPTMTAKTTFGTDTVRLKWNKISGVSGYQVFVMNKKTGKYVLEKTIADAKRNYYNAKCSSGKTYTFRIRCYMEHEGSGKVYSAYSKPVKVTVPKFNKAVKPVARGYAKSGGKRIKFKWSKVNGVDGYQIYWYNPVKKKFVRMDTVKGAKKTAYVTSASKYKGGYTFKIRAYASDPKTKVKCFGKFSTVFTVKMPEQETETESE